MMLSTKKGNKSQAAQTATKPGEINPIISKDSDQHLV